MVLEIINSCLIHRLAHNPNLIYTLLYKKDIFQPFRMHSAFQDIVQNIDSVSFNIEYFIFFTSELYISKLLFYGISRKKLNELLY